VVIPFLGRPQSGHPFSWKATKWSSLFLEGHKVVIPFLGRPQSGHPLGSYGAIQSLKKEIV